MDKQLDKLTKFNFKMGWFHLIQGLLMLVVAFTLIDNVSEFTPQVTQLYTNFNVETMSLETLSKDLFTLPFGILAASFLLFSAGAHFLISCVPSCNRKYRSDLKLGINRFRWYEYALSSSVMIILIASLFGIFDIVSLIMILALNASMNFFGLMMEELNAYKDKVSWEPFVFGCIAGLTPWLAIILYMSANVEQLPNIPWFVWALLAAYAISFNTFPINMYLQYKKVGKWQDYLYGERAYIILSLVSKSILAWLVFAATLAP